MKGARLERVRRYAGLAIDVLVVAVLVFAVWSFLASRRTRQAIDPSLPHSRPLTGVVVPPVRVLSAQRVSQVEFASAPGRPRLVLLFRSDCPVCQRQVPEWNRLSSIARGTGTATLALSPEPVGYVPSRYFGSTAVAVMQLESPSALWTAFGTQAVPTTILVGSDNKVLFQHVGLLGKAQSDSLIASIRREFRSRSRFIQ